MYFNVCTKPIIVIYKIFNKLKQIIVAVITKKIEKKEIFYDVSTCF